VGSLKQEKLALEEDMKLPKFISLIFLLLLIILNGGCGKVDMEEVTPYTDVSTTIPTKLATSTTTSSNTPIKTIYSAKSTPTLARTPMLTPSLLPTHTIQPIIIPTLTIEDANLRLQELLDNNGGCLLPCLWGITPGLNSSKDAMNILKPLKSISDLTYFDPWNGTIAIQNNVGELKISTSIAYLTNSDNEIINRISFDSWVNKKMTEETGVVGVFDSNVFGEQLNQYILPQVLSTYGRPSSVMITTLAEPPPKERGGDIGYFRIILIYPDLGIMVNYITDIHVVGENVVGCPANAHIKLELYPSGQGDTFINNLDPSWQEDIQNNYKPLEEVTSLSIDEFYQLFRQPTEECLVTPSILWPLMED
jgi:hypothetical protein